MLGADLRRDFVVTWFKPLATSSFEDMEAIFERMESDGRAHVSRSNLKIDDLVIARAADMRYVGQEHAVTVDIPLDVFKNQDREAFKRHFDDLHEKRYGYASPNESAEIVSLRSSVSGVLKKPAAEVAAAGGRDPSAAANGNRPVYFAETGFASTPTFKRELLKAGNVIQGPALIEEHASTTVLHPGDVMTVDELGNLTIDVKRG
jgi:N-methylhydantoinase A